MWTTQNNLVFKVIGSKVTSINVKDLVFMSCGINIVPNEHHTTILHMRHFVLKRCTRESIAWNILSIRHIAPPPLSVVCTTHFYNLHYQHMISRQSSCTMQIHHHGRFVEFLTTHDNCPPLNMLVVLSWLHLQCNIQIIPSHATTHVTCEFVDMALLYDLHSKTNIVHSIYSRTCLN